MRVALMQMDIAWNSPAENIQRCRELSKRALAEGAQFIIFPEMFTCGFSMPRGDVARESFEQGAQFLSGLAQSHGVHTLGSLPETNPSAHLFNTALLYKPDGSWESYQKIHLFSYGDETTLYSAGSRVLNTTVMGMRCSIFICYDLRFPLPFYQLADKTDLYVVVANWPKPRREHWLTLLRARAIENQAYVAGVNRVGEGGGLSYCGDSAVFAPDGTQLTQLSDNDQVIVCDIDTARVADWRKTFPALRDRRPAVYQGL